MASQSEGPSLFLLRQKKSYSLPRRASAYFSLFSVSCGQTGSLSLTALQVRSVRVEESVIWSLLVFFAVSRFLLHFRTSSPQR